MFAASQNHDAMKACIETTVEIRPNITVMPDSTAKVLSWKKYGEYMTKIITQDDPLFFIPESLIHVQPCNGAVSVSKK